MLLTKLFFIFVRLQTYTNMKIQLTIGSDTFTALRFSYSFYRVVDFKGRPTTGLLGGDILIELESDSDTTLLELMIAKDPISGSLRIWNGETSVRTLEWEEAWIYSVGETMEAYIGSPMILSLSITSLRMDIDRFIRIDRRWPQTYGFWWEPYVPEEKPVVAQHVEENVIVSDAYWIDPKGNEIRELNVGSAVTLYVILEQYTSGTTMNFTFEDGDKDGEWRRASYSGTVDSNGMVIIENFKLEVIKKEVTNGNA